MRTWMCVVLMGLALALSAGCQQAAEIRTGLAAEGAGVQMITTNDRQIEDAMISVYRSSRMAHIADVQDWSVERLSKSAVDGKVTVADAQAKLKSLLENRAQAIKDTEAVIAGFRRAQAASQIQVQNTLAVNKSLGDWAAAGLTPQGAANVTAQFADILGEVLKLAAPTVAAAAPAP